MTKKCDWPSCLTQEESKKLIEAISDINSTDAILPDKRLECNCVEDEED